MLIGLILFASISKMWHALPLLVAVSLVYAASRHETTPAILSHALRLALYIGAFFLAVFVVLMFMLSRL
jgi:hypothetical protein